MKFINDSLINAASWTLIHSLWLGLILALLAGLTILLTKKSTSAVRYNLLAMLSVVFLIKICYIFSHEYQVAESNQQIRQLAVIKSITPQQNIISAPAAHYAAEKSSPVDFLKNLVNDYSLWIVWIWFVVFSFKCFRMIDGIRHVYRVRNYQTVEPSEAWQHRMSELKALLNVSSKVKLMESKLVNVPSVAGFFKPMILVPIGLLNNLPQEQVEAILLHELAHIRRSDYLVNLIQSFMEIVFFFNPGVMWISSLLKDERENCCDDLAIGVTKDKKEFVHALVSFQQYNLDGRQLAMQFGDRKMHLADRAGRILFNRNTMLSKAEKYFLTICIATGAILCVAFTNVNSATAQQHRQKPYATMPPDSLIPDSVYNTRKYDPKDIKEGTAMRIADEINGKRYHTYIFKHDNVLYQIPEDMNTFMVDGKVVSGTEKQKYEPVVRSLIQQFGDINEEGCVMVNLDEETRKLDEEARKLDEEARLLDIEARKLEKELERENREIEREMARQNREIAQESLEQAKVLAAEAKQMREDAKRLEAEALAYTAEAKIYKKRDLAQAKSIEIQARNLEIQARQMEVNARNMPGYDVIDEVIREVKNNGYKGNIKSVELNERELIINGKKQPESLFLKVKKYTRPGTRHVYNIDVKSN